MFLKTKLLPLDIFEVKMKKYKKILTVKVEKITPKPRLAYPYRDIYFPFLYQNMQINLTKFDNNYLSIYLIIFKIINKKSLKKCL